MRKSLLLVFTLAIPVSVFLFLKIFGNNQFEVPVLYENGIPGCGVEGEVHRVKWNDYQLPPAIQSGNDYLVVAYGPEIVKDQGLYAEIGRISDAFAEQQDVAFVLLFTPDLLPAPDAQPLKLSHYLVRILMESSHLEGFLSCQLGLDTKLEKDKIKLALVDKQGRIRGLYESDDRKQTDRLILELKILIKSEKPVDGRQG